MSERTKVGEFMFGNCGLTVFWDNGCATAYDTKGKPVVAFHEDDPDKAAAVMLKLLAIYWEFMQATSDKESTS